MQIPFLNLNGLAEKEKAIAVQNLITASSPHKDFFIMIILSVLMAAFGLLLNNATIIIGSMLVAPLLYPILTLSLGIAMLDFKLVSRSLYTVTKSILFGIFCSALAVFLFSESTTALTPEILDRTRPSIDYLSVAVIAGLAASFSTMRPQLNERLSGVAIAVALIPPVAVVGIGVARLDWNVAAQSLLLFLINVLGIIVASIIVFALMNLKIQKRVADRAIEKNDRAIKKEAEAKIEQKNI